MVASGFLKGAGGAIVCCWLVVIAPNVGAGTGAGLESVGAKTLIFSGEFYGGDQIYTTGFKDKVVPFSGKAYKLNDSDVKQNEAVKASEPKKPKSCFQRFKDRLRSIFK